MDLPLLVSLPVLLILSGFFSGSETALFGLSGSQRLSLQAADTLAGRAADALLADHRMLLITILLANTTINVLYFVISSLLIMHSSADPVVQTLMAVGFLLLIVLFGEIGPKVAAGAMRIRFVALCAPLLLTFHRAISPLRIVMSYGVIVPLTRLVVPHRAPAKLDHDELRSLLDFSGDAGVIHAREQQLLRDVLAMGERKVRDVMTPRVRMNAVPSSATRDDVKNVVAESRRTKLPVYGANLDDVLGILHVKRFVLHPGSPSILDPLIMTEAQFVPGVATLDQLLEHFRRSQTQSAIVVDEYGGTEGIVSVEDVVEELVGDIVGDDRQPPEPPRLIGLGRWLLSGDMSLHDWTEAFGIELDHPRVATVGGLITSRLGRAPEVGDTIDLGTVQMEVGAVSHSRVVQAVLTIQMPTGGTGTTPGQEPPT